MRRRKQIVWLSFALVLVSCSAIVDFEPLTTGKDSGKGEIDAGSDASNGGRDARGDSARADAQQGACQLGSHEGCASDQLCCDRGDGNGSRCVDVAGNSECAACGVACNEASAPNCGDRVCECEPGSGKGCTNNQRCMGTGSQARCVECETDDDCSARAGRTQCVNFKCEQCDRGAKADDASDDEGCSEPSKPICDPTNTCSACSTNPDNCPGEQMCNGSLGCFGCSLSAPLASNGCGGTNPVCRETAGGPQCDMCMSNADCKGAFCDSRPTVGTGACTNVCAPAGAVGNNSCSGPTPLCKLIGNAFACSACVPADCMGNTSAPFCATEGARQGFCVQCRPGLSDCNPNGTAPVCDETTATCRERRSSDCADGTVFDSVSHTCVECVTGFDCSGKPLTPRCSARNTCVECTVDGECTDSSEPVCNPVTNRCEAGCSNDDQCRDKPGTPHCRGGICAQCGTSSDCSSAASPTTSPICLSNVCVACNASGVADPDGQCVNALGGDICVKSGSLEGRCAVCNPRTQQGCAENPARSWCVDGTSGPSCQGCHPSVPTSCEGTCTLVGGSYECMTVPDAGVTPDAGDVDGSADT